MENTKNNTEVNDISDINGIIYDRSKNEKIHISRHETRILTG